MIVWYIIFLFIGLAIVSVVKQKLEEWMKEKPFKQILRDLEIKTALDLAKKANKNATYVGEKKWFYRFYCWGKIRITIDKDLNLRKIYNEHWLTDIQLIENHGDVRKTYFDYVDELLANTLELEEMRIDIIEEITEIKENMKKETEEVEEELSEEIIEEEKEEEEKKDKEEDDKF